MSAGRILLIEDDALLRKACVVGLKKEGFTVFTAADGEEGIRLALQESPDLILLDLLMPKMSGLETLEILKKDERTHSIPVVILSNSLIESERRKAEDLGAVGYLLKSSLSLKELSTRVASILKKTT